MYVWVNKTTPEKKIMTTEKQSFQMYLLYKMLFFLHCHIVYRRDIQGGPLLAINGVITLISRGTTPVKYL